jgi:hypothetical protein
MRLESDFPGSWTLTLQFSFHIRLVRMAASTQALITLGSASSPEQSLSSPSATWATWAVPTWLMKLEVNLGRAWYYFVKFWRLFLGSLFRLLRIPNRNLYENRLRYTMGYTAHGKPEFHSKKEKLLLTICSKSCLCYYSWPWISSLEHCYQAISNHPFRYGTHLLIPKSRHNLSIIFLFLGSLQCQMPHHQKTFLRKPVRKAPWMILNLEYRKEGGRTSKRSQL